LGGNIKAGIQASTICLSILKNLCYLRKKRYTQLTSAFLSELIAMRIKTKTIILLTLMFTLYGAVNFCIQYFIMFPRFVSLEEGEARKDMQRVIKAIKSETGHLDSLCHDWAAWDDTYDYITNVFREYEESNLQISTFVDNNINLLFLVNIEGRVIWGEIRDSETKEPVRLDQFDPANFGENQPFLLFEFKGRSFAEVSNKGVIMTERGPMLVSSRPILKSGNEGPVRGALLMGRFVDSNKIAELITQVNVAFNVLPVDCKISTEQNEAWIKKFIASGKEVDVFVKSKTINLVYGVINDIQGKPVILLQAEIPREISQKGAESIQYSLIMILIALFLVLVIVVLILQKTIINPTVLLTRLVLSIQKTADLRNRLTVNRKDEIGMLQQEFNNLLEQLALTRKRLLEQSYYSGMSEMVRGILHNIRNSLNPVAAQLELLSQKLSFSRRGKIQQAQDEFVRSDIDPQRKEELAQYILLSNQSMMDLLEKSKQKADQITLGIRLIERILDNHEKWAHQEQPVEIIKVKSLIESSLSMLDKEKVKIITFVLDPNMSEQITVKGYEILLKQVVDNIVLNAIEAIDRFNQKEGIISFRSKTFDMEGKAMVDIEISDNGDGLSAVALEKIFKRGYSSKKQQASGIGLHWCSNTLQSMNGKLTVESNGVGQGCRFHLILPEGCEMHKDNV